MPYLLSQNCLHLALLLPLQADAQMYDVRMERFLKFYEGVLLGLREEKRAGWKFEVYVYLQLTVLYVLLDQRFCKTSEDGSAEWNICLDDEGSAHFK